MTKFLRNNISLFSLVSLTACGTLVGGSTAVDVFQVARESGFQVFSLAPGSCDEEFERSLEFRSFTRAGREAELRQYLAIEKNRGANGITIRSSDSKRMEARTYKNCSNYAHLSREELIGVCGTSLKGISLDGCADLLSYLDPTSYDSIMFAPLGKRLCKIKNYHYCNRLPEAEKAAAYYTEQERRVAIFQRLSSKCLDANDTNACLTAANLAESEHSYEVAEQIAGKGCSLGSMPACSMKVSLVEKMRMQLDRQIANEQIYNQRALAERQMANDANIAQRNRHSAFWNAWMIQSAINNSNNR